MSFIVFLPVSDKDPYHSLPVEPEVIKGSEMILLVVDEALILEVGQALLETLGYHS